MCTLYEATLNAEHIKDRSRNRAQNSRWWPTWSFYVPQIW